MGIPFSHFFLPMMVGKGELIDYKIWSIIDDGNVQLFFFFFFFGLGSFF
jgi:hypothetical protein